MRRGRFLVAIAAAVAVLFIPNKASALGGSGTSGSPYLITDCVELQSMNDDTSAFYKLANNIDCTDTQSWNGGTGWVSVGSFGNRFSGTFDGAGHSITGLYANHDTTSDFGLFGYTQNATIKNFTISGSITNTDSNIGTCVGGLLKFSFYDLTVENVTSNLYISANTQSVGGGLIGCSSASNNAISITDSSVNSSVTGGLAGGLVGSAVLDGIASLRISGSNFTGVVTSENAEAAGIIGSVSGTGGTPRFDISESYVSGQLDAGSSNAGGLIGLNNSGVDTTIDQSYANVTISGSGSYYGGLVGSSSAVTISNSYTNVNISGDTYVGGLIGGGGAGTTATITNSYAIGALTSSNSVQGGLIGGIETADISDSFAAVSIASSWPTTTGGLIGAVTNGVVVNSFVDSSVNSQGCNITMGVGGTFSGNDCTTEPSDSYFKNNSVNPPLNQWDFTTAWATSTLYPCPNWDLTCINGDADHDGATNSQEQAGPNGGDANNDGTSDALQANVASFENLLTHHYQVVATDCDSLSGLQTGSEASTPADEGYDYPMGLTAFHVTCAEPGMTANIILYYYGAGSNANYVLRKWSGNTPYSNIPNVSTSDVSIDGQTAVRFSYSVVDGGELDEDHTANAVIVDPVGPGVKAGSHSQTLAETGASPVLAYAIILFLFTPALLYIGTSKIYV